MKKRMRTVREGVGRHETKEKGKESSNKEDREGLEIRG